MNSKARWSRICFFAGATALLVGALDPLEGAFVILAGAGLLAMSELLRGSERRHLGYWLTVLMLVATGVAAMLASARSAASGEEPAVQCGGGC